MNAWWFMLCWAADIVLTIANVLLYKKQYPLKDWTRIELNGFVVKLWRKFGLVKGTILAAMCTGTGIALLIYFFINTPLRMGVFIGVYVMVFYLHYVGLVDYFNTK